MDKTRALKTTVQRFKDLIKPQRNYTQVGFKDTMGDNGLTEFKHSWANLSHMHDMRMWLISYAPIRNTAITRLEEVHRINQEMWYMVSEALWRRIILFIAAFFLTTRIFRKTFIKKYNNDSHDAHWRDTVSHL